MRHHLAALAGIAVLAAAPAASAETRGVELEARAVLPAETFAPGPPSGSLLGTTPINGIALPFASQPVQGVSAVVRDGDGALWAMADNGYGAKANSGDFLLRAYRIAPRFETARGGTGDVRVGRFIQLRDPDGLVPFRIEREATPERLLTGADFDIESLRFGRDGSLWIGDEFGPYLLHFGRDGALLAPPVPLRGVRSPQNPALAVGEAPTLGGSKGFEGMGQSADGRYVYPILEGALLADADQTRRIISEFDTRRGLYTGRTWDYRVEDAANAIGELTLLHGRTFAIIERDNGQGAAAALKRLYRITLRRDGSVDKAPLADLLDIADPARISEPARPGDIGLGETFTMPFVTIESVLPLPFGRLLVVNDNNFPFSAGRNPTRADDTEMVILRPSAR